MSYPPLSRPAPASSPNDHGVTAGLLAGARVRASMRGPLSSWPDRGARVICIGFAVAALHTGHGSPATRKATARIDSILKDTPGSCCRRWVSENQPGTRASLQFLGSRTTRTPKTHNVSSLNLLSREHKTHTRACCLSKALCLLFSRCI